MANQFLKLRRSSVPGKIPDTASLDFGEIALNTFDGRAFMKKSSSLGEEVIIIGSTQGAFTGSFSGSFTGSLFGTASWAYNALTASTADDFVIRGTLTGSNALFTGTVTAQTLVVQTISSSVIYSSGSNTFGDELTDKQTFTGSVEITGSLSLNGFSVITSDQTGSMSVLSASYASTASYAISASFTQNSISASYVSGSAAIITNLTSSNDARINGVTAGRGAGAEWTVFGQEAANRSSNGYGVAIGYRALYSSTNTGNVAVGRLAARDTTTGRDNVAIGSNALLANTTGQQNTAIGGIALSNINGSYNTAVGNGSFNGVTAGSYNTVVGWLFSTGITTANYNTIIGAGITGLPSVLSNNIILADGQGNIKYRWDAVQNNIYGKLVVTGSVTATQGFTGSLFGTASWALNFVTESVTSASYAYTASSAVSSSYAYTASSAVSSSYSYTASSAVNANSALTASSADDFVVRQSITASNALINGTITAQTLVVQTISSSVIYSSGSNIFGDELTDKQTFTGSVEITGSLSLNGFSVITSDQTGSMSVLSASYASTASYAQSAISASYVSGSAAIVTNLTSSNDASIRGVRIGRGTSTLNPLTNTFVGYDAFLSNVSGYTSTGVGYTALSSSISGIANTAIGAFALAQLTSGQSNTAIGAIAMNYTTTGANNTAIGRQALRDVTTGTVNTAIGVAAGFGLTTGQYNIFIGTTFNGTGIVTGNYNTILGSQLSGLSSTLSNNIILADGQGNIKYRWDATQNNIYGNLAVTGSVRATQGFTGSLFGTASWAQNFITGSVTSASYAYTASSAVSASNALTASSADDFVVRQSITASNALINGTITAQTLVVQTVSSSVVYSSGSNVFGNNLSNTQVFTGSVSITGSLTVNGFTAVLSDQTGSMSVASASYALNAVSASYVSGSAAIVTNLTSSRDARINGLTVGAGAGIQWTVFGVEAGSNASANIGVAVGYKALSSSIANGGTAVGRMAARDTTTGVDNTAIGSIALLNNTTGKQNTAIGAAALDTINGDFNTAVGNNALSGVTSGNYNTALGRLFNTGLTTANYNTIIGAQITGLPSTLSNNIILADGQGNIKYRWDAIQNNIYGNLAVTGSLIATQGLTGSLFGTASNAISSSYAYTASFLIGYNPYQIATGSVTASVDTNADSIFLIKSGSVSFLNISSSGDTTLSSDLFIVKNLTSQQPVLTVSQSVVKIATHSFDPNGTTEAGSIWFTSTAMYVGLE